MLMTADRIGEMNRMETGLLVGSLLHLMGQRGVTTVALTAAEILALQKPCEAWPQSALEMESRALPNLAALSRRHDFGLRVARVGSHWEVADVRPRVIVQPAPAPQPAVAKASPLPTAAPWAAAPATSPPLSSRVGEYRPLGPVWRPRQSAA